MLDGTVFPSPPHHQQGLIFSLLIGIATFLLIVLLRPRCRSGVRETRQQPCNSEAQQPTETETHSEGHMYAGNIDKPCGPRYSASKLRTRTQPCAKGLFHQVELHIDQHCLQSECLPIPDLCVYSARPCQACSSPPIGDSVLTAGLRSPDTDADTTMQPPSASPTAPERKSTGDGSQPLLTPSSPAIVPATPQATFTSKHTGACNIPDLAANVAPGASDVVAEALPSDTACRPDNMSSAYDIARALVCHPWAQSYTPMFTLGRVALKIPDRHPSDLGPVSVWTRPYSEALEKEGISLVGAYVRQGCIHIVLDMLDLAISSGSTGRGTGVGTNISVGQNRHGRHLVESERAERCSSSGTSRSSSRRRSSRMTALMHVASDADGSGGGGGGANAVSASSTSIEGVLAPGDLLPLAVPGHELSTPPQQRLRLSRRNTPVRVRSAEATGVGRIELLARVAHVAGAAAVGNLTRSNGDNAGRSPHGGNDDDDHDDDDGRGSLTAYGRLHLLSARRLRQLRRASASSLVSGAAGIPRSTGTLMLRGLPQPHAQQSASAREAAADGVLSPARAGAAASSLQQTLTPELLVQMLGQEIAGGDQTVTVQLPWGSGVWSVQMQQVDAAPTAVPAPPVARPPPDLSCISPPCVLAGAPGPVMMYAAVTDVQGVAADASEGAVVTGPAASAGSDGALTVHMRFGGAYQPCRSSLLGDQMPAEALNQVLPSDALRRTEVLCVQLAVPPPLPGLMFVECQRGGLLGAASPVLVAPNQGVLQEVAALQDKAVREGGTAMTAVHQLVMDLGLWFNYLSFSSATATMQQMLSQRSGQEPGQGRLQESRPRLMPQVQRPPGQTSHCPGVVPAVSQLEVSTAGDSHHDFAESNAELSCLNGGQQPPASSAGGGTGNGLGRLFGQSLMRLLSDAEIIERETQPQVHQASSHSQLSPLSREEQQRGDRNRRSEVMVGYAEHHQRQQQQQQQQQPHQHRHHGLEEEHAEHPSLRDAGIAEFTDLSYAALMNAGVSGYEGTQTHPELELQLLAPHVDMANRSSPGPGNEADTDAAIAADYMRAISDPQTRREVEPRVVAADGDDGDLEGVGFLACATMPPQSCGAAVAGSDPTRAHSSLLEDDNADKGESGGNKGGGDVSEGVTAACGQQRSPVSVAESHYVEPSPSFVQEALGTGQGYVYISPSPFPSVGQGQGTDITGPFGSKDGAVAAAAAVTGAALAPAAAAVAVTATATAPATCSARISACGVSLAAAAQPPHAQSLYNGRWQLPPPAPSPPPPPQVQPDRSAMQAPWDKNASEGGSRMLPALPLQLIASQSGQALGNGGGAETGDAGNSSAAISADMLALGPLEVAALSHALMACNPSIARNGGSGSIYNLPPVRTESSGTELHSWDSLTEVAQVVSASLPPPSGALVALSRSCSTLATVASPSPSPRPSLQLCNDGTRLLRLGSSNVVYTAATAAAAATPSVTAATSLSLVVGSGGVGGCGSTVTRSAEEIESSVRLQRSNCLLQLLPSVSMQAVETSDGQTHERRLAVETGGNEAKQAHDCVEASTSIAESPAAVAPETVSTTSEQAQSARCWWPVEAAGESQPAGTEAGAAGAGTLEELKRETTGAAGGLAGRVTSTATAGTADVIVLNYNNNVFTDAPKYVIPSISTRAAGGAAVAADLASEAAAVAAVAGLQSAAVATQERVGATWVGPADVGATKRPPEQGHWPAVAAASTSTATSTATASTSTVTTSTATTAAAFASTAFASTATTAPAAVPHSAVLLHARMQHLGLGLLAFSVRRGWAHTTAELMKGLVRVGVTLAAADAAVSAREGGLGLLHLAVIARKPALLQTMSQAAKALSAVTGSNAPAPVGTDVGEVAASSVCGDDFTWDVGARGPLGLTPLHLAIALDDGGEVAAELLEVFPDAPALWFTAADDSGCTPAAMAAQARLDRLTQRAGRRLAEGVARQHPLQQHPLQPGDRSRLIQVLQRQVVASEIHLQQPSQGQPQTASSLAVSSLETTALLGVGAEAAGGRFHSVPGSFQVEEAAATTTVVPTVPALTAITTTPAAATAAVSSFASTAQGGSAADIIKRKWSQSRGKDASWMRWLESMTRAWPKQVQIRESCLRASLAGFADPLVEARYREYRVQSLGVVDRTCGIVFASLFALPALDLAMQGHGGELASHCIFNAGLLGPYLLLTVAPALFRKYRDAALMIGDVVKALLVLLALLGAVPLPQIWAEFARGYMDVVMLVVIKPLSEQIGIRVAVLQRITAVMSDTYMYASVLYGGAILPAVVRAVLQNAAALALLLLLDMRARLRFLTATSTRRYHQSWHR